LAEAQASSQAPVIHLPFWELAIEAQILAANKQQSRRSSLLNDLGIIWVAGFNMARVSYFGDLGLAYTEKGIALTPRGHVPAGTVLAGCGRGYEEASRYPELFVSLILDKRTDVTGMELAVKIKKAALWAVPMLDCGDHVFDPVTGTKIPAFALDDLQALRVLHRS
jgi:hypothetical protein